MAILRREAQVLSGVIPGDEKVHCIAVQHRMDYALLNPSVAVATEKRLVVCSRLFMGIKQDIAFIQYGAIVSMRLDSGIVFSSLRLRLHGSVNRDGRGSASRAWTEEGEINGLRRKDAIRLAKVISRKMDEAALEREKKEGDYGRAAKYNEGIRNDETDAEAVAGSGESKKLNPHVYPENLRIFEDAKNDGGSEGREHP